MARGRTANLVPTVQWAIMVPIDLAFQVETQLMDPVTKQAGYGTRSKLIQSLLYEWLKSQGVRAAVPTELFCPDCKRPKATSDADVLTGACPKWHVDNEDTRGNCATSQGNRPTLVPQIP